MILNDYSGGNWQDPCIPGLWIEGVGSVSLPLSAEQGQLILSKAKQAPFGMFHELDMKK